MTAMLEVIGALIMTIFILGIPVLSFASFAFDWHEFPAFTFIILLAVDVIAVMNMVIEVSKNE